MPAQSNQPANAPDKMLTKIRALLAKAEDRAATPEEAKTYTAKATELMARYGVDRAMLAAADPTTDILGDRVVIIHGPYALDKQHLLSQVALSLGCRSILRTRWVDYKKQRQVHLFGYASDLERAEMLYTSLLVQAANGIAQTPVPYYETAAAFRRSWLEGFTDAVVSRLHAAERRAKEEAEQRRTAEPTTAAGPSVALVLADRSALINSKVAETYPKLGKTAPRNLSGSGHYDGYRAGRRADLGGTRVGTSTRGALGGAR